jgi:hypothetical protein
LDTILIIVLILLFFAGFLAGTVFLAFPGWLLKWSENKFADFLKWRGELLFGKAYDPQNPLIWPRSFLIWVMRLVGAGFTIVCAFAIYNIIVIFFVD